MEIIGVILVLVFALVSASDRKKKAARQAEQHRASMGATMNAAGQAAKPVAQMSMAERQERKAELQRMKAERQAQQAGKAQTPATPGNAEASFQNSLNELKQLLNVDAQAAPAEGESMLVDDDCAGGSMPHSHGEGASALADDDCAGGSMPHQHTQGESRKAHNRRLSELDSRQARNDPDSLVPAAIDAQTLRRAVVMAEVLGRPKALKRV